MSSLVTPFRDQIAVGVITIRPDETAYFLSQFKILDQIEYSTQTYSILETAKIDSKGNKRYIAHISTLRAGLDSARDITSHFIQDLQPECLLLVGIAGGIPNEDIFLGDVVISDSVITPVQSASENDRSRSLQTKALAPNKQTKAVLSKINAALHTIDTPLAIYYDKPSESLDYKVDDKTESMQWREKCRNAAETFRRRTRTDKIKAKITIKNFYSSSERIKDSNFAANIIIGNREIHAIEMELAGCIEAVQALDSEIPVLSVRGISDIIGIVRNQAQWNPIACSNAAALAKLLIDHDLLQANRGFQKKFIPSRSRGPLRRKLTQESVLEPLDLFKLGDHQDHHIKLELLSSDGDIEPTAHFSRIAKETKRGKNPYVLGWNVRPAKELNAIHLAYLQILGRFSEFNFKIQVNIYDTCTTKAYKDDELETLSSSFISKLRRFKGVSGKSVSTVSRTLRNKPASEFAKDIFRIARVSLGESRVAFSDPATTFDNLLCMVVEEEAKYNIILAGGRDTDEYWRRYRSKLNSLAKRDYLSFMLVFPELKFGASSSATEADIYIPVESDSVDSIKDKLTKTPQSQYSLLWDAIVAPSGTMSTADQVTAELLAQGIFAAFRTSQYLLRG